MIGNIGVVAAKFMDDLYSESAARGEIEVTEVTITCHLTGEDGKKAVGYRTLTHDYGRVYRLLLDTEALHVEHMVARGIQKGARLQKDGVDVAALDAEDEDDES